ncbi:MULTISPECIES: hypothetical protein [Bradyrhizobium]|uniref:hypothetical protein n=1 Tax=Bradyrhizobium TaxID=374 RepID=UPI002304C133|nr:MULTISPECIES: hypothetical protein [Bradyrhizobium]MDF0583911.1 hypothetical protein [Bradyrhizobium yuanmingense]
MTIHPNGIAIWCIVKIAPEPKLTRTNVPQRCCLRETIARRSVAAPIADSQRSNARFSEALAIASQSGGLGI